MSTAPTIGQQNGSSRTIALDCRYFLGNQPCLWHKREGALCVCDHYRQTTEHLLVIKLGAMGDVLRTTALLPGLAGMHPSASITWITKPESVPLLQNNEYLTEVVSYDADALTVLQSRSFDRVINLDADKISAGLATMAQAPRKDGFVLSPEGQIRPTNPAAQTWFELGLFDDLKRKNRRTYQSLMLDILGLPQGHHHYVFELTPAERSRAERYLESLGIDPALPLVGLNTGAGGRWELKRWRMDGFAELIGQLHEEMGAQVLLLGGKEEKERNARLRAEASCPVFDAGCDHAVRDFAALVQHCDVVVTGDTLALHIALAVKTRVVALFGPTSAPEIELYDQGEKVVPDMECLACYKTTCDFVPNCMDLIRTDLVMEATARQLRLAQKKGVAHAAD
jgi:heptosyltransferase-2